MIKKSLCLAKKINNIQLLIFAAFFFVAAATHAIPTANGAMLQKPKVTGKVTDKKTGETIIGATVLVKGTSIGTITDLNGAFALDIPDENSIIAVSYVGYVTLEKPADCNAPMLFELVENLLDLEEVVVVGYGTQKKLDLTSAISTISVNNMKSTPTINTETFMQGRAAGVMVAANTGAPGSTVTVKIRGVVTTGNSDPLYIVDGIPMAEGGVDNKFGINSLNPYDIESIQILKDASSAAIYGSRASNGVVLITTKRGKEGKMSFNLESYYGMQYQARRIDVLNKAQFKQYYDMLGQFAPRYDDFDDPAKFAELPDFDWQKEIFTPAPTSNIQFSVSGGNEKSVFMISLGNNAVSGLVKNSNFNRSNLRINSDHKINKWLKFGESLSLSYSQRRRVREGTIGYNYVSAPPITTALLSDPTTKAYDENGNWNYMRHTGTFNAAGIRDRANYKYNNKKLNGSLYFEISPVKDLKFKSNFGLEYNLGETKEFLPSFNVAGSYLNEGQQVPSLKQMDEHSTYLIMEHTLNYSKVFNKHSLIVLAGFTVEQNSFYDLMGFSLSISGNEDYLQYLDAGNPSDPNRIVSGGAFDWRMYSYLGRINYDYNDRYLLTASVRRDASSRFGPNNRAGYFPSFTAGWKISNETFLKDISWLYLAKIRVGWGQVGNQNNIGNYSYNTTIQPDANYAFGDPKVSFPGVTAGINYLGYGGIAGGKPGNRDLTWETTQTTNIGLDLSFFDNKLSVTTDWFYKDNMGMLMESTVPDYLGIVGPDANGGKIANQGFELEIVYRKLEGKFTYDAAFNFSYIHTEVKEMKNIKYSNSIDGIEFLSRTMEGGGIADFWGLKTDGTFKDVNEVGHGPFQNVGTKEGDQRFVDMNKDGLINEYDYTVIGNPLPDFTYGANFNLYYGSFELNLFLQGVYGNEIYNNLYRIMMGRFGVNHHVDILNSWTINNPDSEIPRFDETSSNNNLRRLSDRWIEDGSYLRMKTLSLGYTFPSRWMDKVKISKLRIYATVQNLYTFSKYKGFDPEVSQSVDWKSGGLDLGVDNGNYPHPRTVLVGFSMSF